MNDEASTFHNELKGLDKLTKKQIGILESRKSKLFQKRKEIHNDIMPLIVQSLNQSRGLMKDIAIISGAIATFSLPLLTSSIVKTHMLLYIAIAILFFIISFSIYHVKEIVTREINELNRQHSTYIDLLSRSIDSINKVYSDGNTNHLKKFDAEEIEDKLKSLKVDQRPDNALDNLWKLHALALIFILLSLVDFYKVKVSYLDFIISLFQ